MKRESIGNIKQTIKKDKDPWKIVYFVKTKIFNMKMPTAVIGDFHSKHTSWDCNINNHNGNILFNYVIYSKNKLKLHVG